TDVFPARRCALPVRADGRSGDVGDGLLVHPLAHAGADDGKLSAAQARAAHRHARARWPAAAVAQPAGATPARLRAALRAVPPWLPGIVDDGDAPPAGVRRLLPRLRDRLIRARALSRPRLLSLCRRRTNPDARAHRSEEHTSE